MKIVVLVLLSLDKNSILLTTCVTVTCETQNSWSTCAKSCYQEVTPVKQWQIGCQPPAKCTTSTSQVVFGSGLCWQHVGHSAKVLTDLYKYLEIGEMSRRLPISRCCVFGLSEVSHVTLANLPPGQ